MNASLPGSCIVHVWACVANCMHQHGSQEYRSQDLGSQSHISSFSLLTRVAVCMLLLQVALMAPASMPYTLGQP